MRVLVLFVLAAVAPPGCPRRPDTVRAAPSASASPILPEPAPIAPAPPQPRTRVRGAVEGRFWTHRRRVVAGEPIVIVLEYRSPDAPLTVGDGGDSLNWAWFPTRTAVKATDASGSVVCNSVEKPVLMSMGGPVGDRTFAAGELHTERFVLNPQCPALASPGSFHVTLHRRLTNFGMKAKEPGSSTEYICDTYPLHEGPPGGRVHAGCVPLVDAAPSITTELDLRVDPFDAAVVRAETAARLAEMSSATSATPKDELGRGTMFGSICASLLCGRPAACGWSTPARSTVQIPDQELVDALPATLPPSFPSYCTGPGR